MGLVGEICGCAPFGSGSELRQTIDHPLFGLLVGKVVGELNFHIGQPEQRYRADGLHVGDACHLYLERDRDVSLDFFGRLARALRDHIDQRRHRVGIGFDIEFEKTGDPGNQYHHQHRDHQHALTQCERYDRVHEEARTAT